LKYRKKLRVIVIILSALAILYIAVGTYNSYEYKYSIKLFPQSLDKYELLFPIPVDNLKDLKNAENKILSELKKNIKVLNGNVDLKIIDNNEIMALEIKGFGDADIISTQSKISAFDFNQSQDCQYLSLWKILRGSELRYYILNKTNSDVNFTFEFSYQSKTISSGNFINSDYKGTLINGENILTNDFSDCIMSSGAPRILYLILVLIVFATIYLLILFIKIIKNRNTQHKNKPH